VFDDSGREIVDKHIDVSSKDILGTATQVNGKYRLDKKQHTACAVAPTANQNIWHRRLGHLNYRSLNLVQELGDGVQFEGGYVMPCESCIKGKQYRKTFPISVSIQKCTS
jgi:hypothetical protein